MLLLLVFLSFFSLLTHRFDLTLRSNLSYGGTPPAAKSVRLPPMWSSIQPYRNRKFSKSPTGAYRQKKNILSDLPECFRKLCLPDSFSVNVGCSFFE